MRSTRSKQNISMCVYSRNENKLLSNLQRGGRLASIIFFLLCKKSTLSKMLRTSSNSAVVCVVKNKFLNGISRLNGFFLNNYHYFIRL